MKLKAKQKKNSKSNVCQNLSFQPNVCIFFFEFQWDYGWDYRLNNDEKLKYVQI